MLLGNFVLIVVNLRKKASCECLPAGCFLINSIFRPGLFDTNPQLKWLTFLIEERPTRRALFCAQYAQNTSKIQRASVKIRFF
jgi:hypothetical protein